MNKWGFAVLAALVSLPAAASAQDTVLNRYTLENLQGVFVRPSLGDTCEGLGVTMGAIQAAAETALLEGDVTLMTEEEMLEDPALPELRIELDCVDGNGSGMVAFAVSVRMLQSAQMIRDPQITLAEAVTWYTTEVGLEERTGLQGALDGAAAQAVATFVTAYREANAEDEGS